MAESSRKKPAKKSPATPAKAKSKTAKPIKSKPTKAQRKRPVGESAQKPKTKSAAKKPSAKKAKGRGRFKLGLASGEPKLARLTVGLPAPKKKPDPLENLGELPESYGTRRVFAIARDPEWIYTYWDWSWEQLEELRSSTQERKAFVRLLREDGTQLQQVLVEGGTRDWFFHHREPGARFFAELGVYIDGHFQQAGSSGITEQPRLSAAPGPVRFATVPVSLSFDELGRLVEFHRMPGERLLETVARLQEEGFVFPFEVPRRSSMPNAKWSQLVEEWEEEFRRVIRVGSDEIVKTWRVRHGLFKDSDQSLAAQAPSSWISSWGGSESAMPQRQFFMHVNAELIIYGGTDPRAHVTVDGKDIELSPDGTFHYHFVLPDGTFHIPISATSPDGVETRAAKLSFLRATEKSGDVANTGQPQNLDPPMGRTVD